MEKAFMLGSDIFFSRKILYSLYLSLFLDHCLCVTPVTPCIRYNCE